MFYALEKQSIGWIVQISNLKCKITQGVGSWWKVSHCTNNVGDTPLESTLESIVIPVNTSFATHDSNAIARQRLVNRIKKHSPT